MINVMGQKRFTGICIALILGLSSAVQGAQLAGRVQDNAGSALAGATVEAWDNYPGGSVVGTATSDKSGNFNLNGLPGSGPFDLRVWREISSGGPGSYRASHFPTVVRDLPDQTLNTGARLLPTPLITAYPSALCDYYHLSSTFLGSVLKDGDIVEAVDPNGVTCGVDGADRHGGVFGWLIHARGDDDLTASVPAAFVLPPLTTEQAILLWHLLTDLADVVWNAHEQGMVEVFAAQADTDVSHSPSPPDDDYDDDDVPF